MANLGQTSYRASRIAVVDTGAYKVAVEFEELQAEWLARAEGLGFSREAVEGALHRQAHQRSEDLDSVAERLVGAGGLTQKRASFTRRDVIRAWSEALSREPRPRTSAASRTSSCGAATSCSSSTPFVASTLVASLTVVAAGCRVEVKCT